MSCTNIQVAYKQPDPEYRRAPGESQSHLKKILKSPAHYKAELNRKFPSSPAMTIGTATHCLVLEGADRFNSDFIKKPDGISYTTKEGKEWRTANSKKTILANDGKERMWDCVHGMSAALKTLDWFDESTPDYRKYNEVSIYWEELGIPCKARLDRVIVEEDQVIVLDLKTTDSVSTEKFQGKMVDLGYDFQAGWYSHAAELVYEKPARFIFVAVERGAPHTMDFFEMPPSVLKEARYKNQVALERLKNCRETDQWPTVAPTLKMLEYPRWYDYFSDQESSLVNTPEQADDFVPLF